MMDDIKILLEIGSKACEIENASKSDQNLDLKTKKMKIEVKQNEKVGRFIVAIDDIDENEKVKLFILFYFFF